MPHKDSGPTGIYANGTVTLLDTGTKKILVTCAHVWTDFLEYQKTIASAGALATVFRNGPGQAIIIDPASLIDYGSSLLDIAVFEAHPAKWAMGFKEFHEIKRWPLPKVEVGKPVSFVGFAGTHRTVTSTSGSFDYSMFGLTVTDVSNYQFLLADRGTTFDNNGKMISRIDMGGMSGSPVFLRNRGAGFELAGILSAQTNSGIFITHASFLSEDGHLMT